MSNHRNLVFVLLLLMSPCALAQFGGIINSKHNLSVTGTGSIRATAEREVCVFCHTPHQAKTVQPLWNRNVPTNTYRVYASSTLDAKPGQPTGSSKLCLSCHDGTVALGSLISRNSPVGMAGGITTIPPGAKGLIGTDLSDDHPISFLYDSALAGRDPKLKDPATLPRHVRLDSASNVQCSTCHDAHNNTNNKFLVQRNDNSQLCNTCHVIQTTNVESHTNCISCHQIHTAPSGAELLLAKTATETCTSCHNSRNDKAADIATDLAKASVHDTKAPINAADAIPNQSSCTSCHESHSMTSASGGAVAPAIKGVLGKTSGVSSTGTAVPVARFEYEVCFKCHADQQAKGVETLVTRQIIQNNTRLEFDTSAISYHPVQQAGRNPDVPSLRTDFTVNSLIYCTDCHSSDAGRAAGGTGPTGPHGSNWKPLLALRYDTTDPNPESAQAYALCYKCHDRNSILADESFPHKKHVVDSQTACSICHDAHGIPASQGNPQSNSHLINFDTKIVRPDSTGLLRFNDGGRMAGTCNLTCHGVEHNAARSYPPAPGVQMKRAIFKPEPSRKPSGGKLLPAPKPAGGRK